MSYVLPSSPIDRIVQPIWSFSKNRVAGGMLLLVAAVIAIAWANSAWSGTYHQILAVPVSVAIGGIELEKTLLDWINDGVMGVFFFVVGLEIKRELLAGEISSVRKATLPAAAAVGGMLAPALIYLAFNAGRASQYGWGVPVATDIAFALGVVALLGKRVPRGLVVYLTALAIVDDIGAVLIIALYYSGSISLTSLVVAAGFLSAAIAANRLGVRNPLFYLILGAGLWLAFLESGIHGTLAAVLMAMTIPARTRLHGQGLLDRIYTLTGRVREAGVPSKDGLLTEQQHIVLSELSTAAKRAMAPLQRLEDLLSPIVAVVVLPVFALANAGVTLGADILEPVKTPIFAGVFAGLVIGKQIGISAITWLAVKIGAADLPEGVTWRQIHAVSLLAGIGFTMALFINGMAFSEAAARDAGKLAVLAASLFSGVAGALALLRATARADPPGYSEQ